MLVTSSFSRTARRNQHSLCFVDGWRRVSGIDSNREILSVKDYWSVRPNLSEGKPH
ncbi:hypothetical protein E2320_008357, partial [Naja naja]